MVKNAIQYAVVDAFAAEPFKGNPAAVCLLEGEDAAAAADERWMQSVAAEFNLSETAFLIRDPSSSAAAADAAPRFRLRWFTPVAEVNLCGHATLASAHFLFTTVLAKQQHAAAAMVEFVTRSGILTAKKVPAPPPPANDGGVPGEEKLFIELDFPMIDLVEYDSAETLSIPETLNGARVVSVWKSSTAGDLIVELSSGKEVADIIPNINEIKKCDGRGVIVTGPAPAGSDYDFFSRFFCPNFGIDEVRNIGIDAVMTDIISPKNQNLLIPQGSCVWKRTLCSGTLLGWKAGETKTYGVSGFAKEWNIVLGAGRREQESPDPGRSCHCDGRDSLGVASLSVRVSGDLLALVCLRVQWRNCCSTRTANDCN
ncbi:uncharacterized protein LOC127781115 isoform X1 [Oryza glaberrima]|uniref:uncharacterized protein LOC127781115 isoform X1 n=1 Tax=Oryza glaberrima TaxID=4538 RepID=UPI00224C1D72|nr:uncharacterized protein LOC127781115 isoform X1 [Oryza glaberrima]